MKRNLRMLASAAALAGLAVAAPGIAGASERGWWHDHGQPSHVVFVQNDNLSGNQVVAYDRASDGSLSIAGTYATGGLGGQLNGSVADHLASQGGLAYDARHRVLLAVNAGSNTISVFSVRGDDLTLRQVLPSQGTFPSSITVSGDLAYVLNATNGGSIAGFRFDDGKLHAIAGSVRPLGLTTPTDASQFTHTPGQVAFSPDGSQLLVTTKATTSSIDVFSVRHDGRASWTPTVTALAGTVPFALTFDASGNAVVVEAAGNVATFSLHADGSLGSIASVATNQKASCWITGAGSSFFVSNAGSATVSSYTDAGSGALTGGATTPTDKGTVDASATPDGAFLYVQAGVDGIVNEFAVGLGGALSPVGSVTVPGGAGGEGIVAL